MTDDEIDAVIAGLGKLYSTLGSGASVSVDYLKETILNAGQAIGELRHARNSLEQEVDDLDNALEEGQSVWAEARKSRLAQGGYVTSDGTARIIGYDPAKMQESIDKALEHKVASGFSRLTWENGP